MLVVLHTSSKFICIYEVDIVIHILKLKKLSLRMAKGHTVSQLCNQDSNPGLSDSDGQAANDQLLTPGGVSLAGWQILYQSESLGLLLSDISYAAQRQKFLRRCWLITAASHSLKFLLFPQEKHSNISNRGHCLLVGAASLSHYLMPHALPYW